MISSSLGCLSKVPVDVDILRFMHQSATAHPARGQGLERVSLYWSKETFALESPPQM